MWLRRREAAGQEVECKALLPDPEILDPIDSIYFVRCSSKKEKCEKHKRCSRKAEAKKDHRIECGVPGH
jgi:hypothetical protein